jgi:HD-GYP domain-containing protein (c-di-GMP phosphodiesterase class II)
VTVDKEDAVVEDSGLIDLRATLTSAVINLNVALRNQGLYGEGHPMAALWTGKSLSALEELLSQVPRAIVKMVHGDLIFEGERILDNIDPIRGLVEAFSAREVESVTFLPGIEEQEVVAFLDLLRSDPQALKEAGGAAEGARARALSHIIIEALHYSVDGVETAESRKGRMGGTKGGADLAARDVYLSALRVVKDIVEAARVGRPVDAEQVTSLSRHIVDRILLNESGLTALTSIKTFDEYTFEHCVNLAILALALGSRIGLDQEQLVELGTSALLHDLGKVFVPMEILRTPKKLSPEEWALMEKHPVDGARLLARQAGLPALAPVVAYEHHLKYNLSGYPRGSRRKALNLFSSAVTLADCYDALTTPRPYRDTLMPHQALEIMEEGRGKDFEPRLLNYFREMLGPHPVGSCVYLADGQIALVTKVDSRPPFDLWLLPLATSEDESASEAEEIHLSAAEVFGAPEERKIVEAVDPTAHGLDISHIIATYHDLPR